MTTGQKIGLTIGIVVVLSAAGIVWYKSSQSKAKRRDIFSGDEYQVDEVDTGPEQKPTQTTPIPTQPNKQTSPTVAPLTAAQIVNQAQTLPNTQGAAKTDVEFFLQNWNVKVNWSMKNDVIKKNKSFELYMQLIKKNNDQKTAFITSLKTYGVIFAPFQ